MERDRVAALEEEVARLMASASELAADRDKATAEREQYHALYLQMVAHCRKLELGLIGQKAERSRLGDAQMSLALIAELLGRDATPDPTPPAPRTVRAHERTLPTGRKPLPAELPRVDIELVPAEVEEEGRAAFERIGEEVSETIERRPASIVVVRVHRPKFVRKDRERCAETEVLCEAAPELPIERGLAGPGFLADTIVRRWQDHLPLHRLEKIYARDGLPIARSTVCGWHAALGDLVRPLIDAMWADARGAPYLCIDATGVLVQAKEKCKNGHFWVVVAPERHVLYAYSARHDGAAVDAMLDGYEGYLVADAHAVYDHLFKTGKVVEVACWAHARRYWWKALESDPERSRAALALIGEIFRLERAFADLGACERLERRAAESRPVVERFFTWCEDQVASVLDGSPAARAVGYARNQRQALERFLDDGRLPVHNNISELALRRQVVGRKNWLFVGSDDAAEVNAAFVSLLATCRLHGIEPWAYLRDLFCILPGWPVARVIELAPINWKATRKQEDTEQRLAANVYRRAVVESLRHPDPA